MLVGNKRSEVFLGLARATIHQRSRVVVDEMSTTDTYPLPLSSPATAMDRYCDYSKYDSN